LISVNVLLAGGVRSPAGQTGLGHCGRPWLGLPANLASDMAGGEGEPTIVASLRRFSRFISLQ
jgi:hypothetical protein